MTKLWGIGLFICLLLTSCAGQGSLEKALALCLDCKSIEAAIEFEKGLGSTLLHIDSVGISKTVFFSRPKITFDTHSYSITSKHYIVADSVNTYRYFSQIEFTNDSIRYPDLEEGISETHDFDMEEYAKYMEFSENLKNILKNTFPDYGIESEESMKINMVLGENRISYSSIGVSLHVTLTSQKYQSTFPGLNNIPDKESLSLSNIYDFEKGLGSKIIADSVRLALLEYIFEGDSIETIEIDESVFSVLLGDIYFKRPKGDNNIAPLAHYRFSNMHDSLPEVTFYWSTNDSMYIDKVQLFLSGPMDSSMFEGQSIGHKEIFQLAKSLGWSVQKNCPTPCDYHNAGWSDIEEPAIFASDYEKLNKRLPDKNSASFSCNTDTHNNIDLKYLITMESHPNNLLLYLFIRTK